MCVFCDSFLCYISLLLLSDSLSCVLKCAINVSFICTTKNSIMPYCYILSIFSNSTEESSTCEEYSRLLAIADWRLNGDTLKFLLD